MTPLKLAEIATRIQVHLVRFETDPKINHYDDNRSIRGLRPYYHANSFSSGNRIGVVYIIYQGTTYLTKAQAAAYLAALDAGFVGRHFNCPKGREIGGAP